MDVDQSLDEIIKSRGSERRGRGRGRGRGRAPRSSIGKAEVLGVPAVTPATRVRAAPTTNGVKAVVTSEKIVVSNLPPDVNEGQIKELFHTTVGPVAQVNLHFDNRGVSKGSATVAFGNRGDAKKAYDQYNGRLIDGKRPMKIEMIADLSKPVLPSLANRVAPAPTPVAQVVPRTGGRPRRARGGGRRKGNERPRKTVEDLDAEMEDYTITNAPAAAATA